MSERHFRRNEWRHMCNGPDEERAADHEERARFHAMMAKFYRMPANYQRAAMAALEAMEESDDG